MASWNDEDDWHGHIYKGIKTWNNKIIHYGKFCKTKPFKQLLILCADYDTEFVIDTTSDKKKVTCKKCKHLLATNKIP